MPIILVQSEKTAGGAFDHYEDITGKTYQFPNQYKNLIVSGEQFIYYRGLRKRDGTRRKHVEYFGYGVIETVSKNDQLSGQKKKDWKWDCTISEFQEFDQPVIAKKEGIATFENISNNSWGSVRSIPKESFYKILSEGLKSYERFNTDIVPKLKINNKKESIFKSSRKIKSTETDYFSKRAKFIGDLGEKYVLEELRKKLSQETLDTLRWVADENEKPGWDIEYIDENKNLIAIEVKATTQKNFSSIQITKREWEAAKDKRDHFELWLITEIESQNPTYEIISDPFGFVSSKEMVLIPSIYKLEKAKQTA